MQPAVVSEWDPGWAEKARTGLAARSWSLEAWPGFSPPVSRWLRQFIKNCSVDRSMCISVLQTTSECLGTEKGSGLENPDSENETRYRDCQMLSADRRRTRSLRVRLGPCFELELVSSSINLAKGQIRTG